MKKIILLLSLLLFSCNSSDYEEIEISENSKILACSKNLENCYYLLENDWKDNILSIDWKKIWEWIFYTEDWYPYIDFKISNDWNSYAFTHYSKETKKYWLIKDWKELWLKEREYEFFEYSPVWEGFTYWYNEPYTPVDRFRDEWRWVVVKDWIKELKCENVSGFIYSPDWKKSAYVCSWYNWGQSSKENIIENWKYIWWKENKVTKLQYTSDSKILFYFFKDDSWDYYLSNWGEGSNHYLKFNKLFECPNWNIGFCLKNNSETLLLEDSPIEGILEENYYPTFNSTDFKISNNNKSESYYIEMYKNYEWYDKILVKDKRAIGLDYKKITSFKYSPDGNKFLYTALKENWKVVVVLDWKESNEYDKIESSSIIFSSDWKSLSFPAKKNWKWILIKDFNEIKKLKTNDSYPTDFWYINNVFYYTIKKGWKEEFILNWKLEWLYDNIFIYEEYSILSVQKDWNSYLLKDWKKITLNYEKIHSLTQSKDWKEIIFIAKKWKKYFLIKKWF